MIPRLADILMVMALTLAATWLAMVALGLRLPLGLPRNLLIWLAIGTAAASFWLSWRELSKKK